MDEVLDDVPKEWYLGNSKLTLSFYNSVTVKSDGRLRVSLTLTEDEFEYLHRQLLKIQEPVLNEHHVSRISSAVVDELPRC